MLRSILSNAMKVRLALLVAELALPKGADLSSRVRSVLFGVMFVVAGGVMAACAVLTIIYATAYALLQQGQMNEMQVILAAIIFTIVSICALLAIGCCKLKKAFCVSMSDRPSLPQKNEDFLSEFMNGFVEGLVVGKTPKNDH